MGSHGPRRKAKKLQDEFLTVGPPRNCPIEGCRGQTATKTDMRVHFLHWHIRDTVIILKKGNPSCPWCLWYNMLVPWKDLNGQNVITSQCAKRTERKRRKLSEEEMQERTERAFQTYVRPFAMVISFKYLGGVLTASDEDCQAVVGSLWKAWKSRARMARLLGREGDRPRVLGMFFKAVMQADLLFRSDMWVMTPCMGRDLGSFCYRVDRRIIGRHPRRKVDRILE